MMDWTDRHYRVFMRGITKRTLLYTEMVTTNAALHGDRERMLGFSEIEKTARAPAWRRRPGGARRVRASR